MLEVGQQRVKLDGRAAREPFGGNALVISIYYEETISIQKILFGHELNDFLQRCSFSPTYSLIFLCRSKMSAFIIRAILLLLRKNFSHFAVGEQFFSCNFSAISLRAQKLVRKGSLLIPAPISSPLTQLQATNARQISDKKLTQVLKVKSFLNGTISRS